MLLQDVILKLKELNINMANSTLRNYQRDGLIPSAKRTSRGFQQGTVTEYPDDVVPEIYSAYQMLNGELAAKVELLKRVRETVLAIDEGRDVEYPYGDMVMYYACCLWIAYREKARTGKDYMVEFSTHDHNGKPYYSCHHI